MKVIPSSVSTPYPVSIIIIMDDENGVVSECGVVVQYLHVCDRRCG